MKDTILNNLKDDDDTIIVSGFDETEFPAMRRKHANKALLSISMIIAIASGTIIGIFSAMTAALANVTNIAGMPESELEALEADGWYRWLGSFSGGEHAQADMISRNMIIIGVLVILFLASLIILSIQTCRNAAGKASAAAGADVYEPAADGSTVGAGYDADTGKHGIRMTWLDRIWSEIQIIIMGAAASFAVLLAIPVFKLTPVSGWVSSYTPYEKRPYFYEINNNTVLGLCIAGMTVFIAIAVVCFAVLVKKIYAGKLIDKSLLGILLGWLGVGAKYAGKGAVKAGRGVGGAIRSAGRGIKGTSRGFTVPADTDRSAVIKIMTKYILIALGLIFIPDIFGMFAGELGVTFICQIIAAVLAVILIVRKISKLVDIRAGVIEVKSGNLSHKIDVREDENGPKTDLDKLASDINHISEATNAAVQNEIKNQRLKTDLISNVSHDLKTPLTSMISYLDILEKEGLDSPDAEAHLSIVREKTDRLRTLTEDLFEAAKASSGNIPCDITDIDIRSLIEQSLAEMGDRLSKKKLKIRKNFKTDSPMVRADGKLLSRVFENLLGNISKYALDRSRVYIDVSEVHDGKILIEIKNISKDELNISADELMERFTRGDSSRNTEGSGLGLAIAKDLTTLMGGRFNISIDGDMFKASIMLDRA